MRSTIYGHGRGWVFTPAAFAELNDRRVIVMALIRKGVVRQLARSLYDYPVDHPAFGRITPSADAIAKALAASHAIREHGRAFIRFAPRQVATVLQLLHIPGEAHQV